MINGDKVTNALLKEYLKLTPNIHINRGANLFELDYPTADSWKKHNQAKKEGLIPSNAKIGGDIKITVFRKVKILPLIKNKLDFGMYFNEKRSCQ